VVVAGAGHGEPPARFELQGGGAWVASSRVGLVTLIDGASAQVSARVKVADGPSDLGVAQRDATGYAVDRRQGTVSRIDPTTFAVGPRVKVIDGASGRVTAYPTDDAVYVLDEIRGRIAVTAPDSVDTVAAQPQSLAGSINSTAVDETGRLWAVTADGDLIWFDGAERHGPVSQPQSSELVVADGGVALIDRAARTVTTLTDRGGAGDRACIDMDTADLSLRFAGAVHRPWLYAVSGEDGLLRVSNLGTGTCGDVAIPIADPGDDLGAPREVAGRVFVPDFTTGTVAIVDVGSAKARHTDELVPAGTTFELFGKDGITFYNDPNSERAGVVHLDGTFTAVAKYNPANPGAGVEPSDGRDPPATGDGDENADKGDDPKSPTTTAPDDPDRPDREDPSDDPPDDPDRPPLEPPRPGDTRPPRPDERPPRDPEEPPSTTEPPTTEPPTTEPPTTEPPTTEPPTTEPPTTEPPTTEPPTTIPPDSSPPNVSTPVVVSLTDGGGGDCNTGDQVCNLVVTANANDPESGIADLRIMMAFGYFCTNASDSIIIDGHIPSSIGSTDQGTITATDTFSCGGDRFIENLSFRLFARATNRRDLTADSGEVIGP